MAKVQDVPVFRSLKIGAWILLGNWCFSVGACLLVLHLRGPKIAVPTRI